MGFLVENFMKEIFTKIYRRRTWGSQETISGIGSRLSATIVVRERLPILFKKYKIKRLLDLGCGDFNWMKEIANNLDYYIGIDVVDEIIEENNKKYKSEVIEFNSADISQIDLSVYQVDAIIIADVFTHFSYENILSILNKVQNSNIKYVFITNYIDNKINYNIKNGNWRPLNLCIEPFNLSPPLEFIKYNDIDDISMRKSDDRTLSLWPIKMMKEKSLILMPEPVLMTASIPMSDPISEDVKKTHVSVIIPAWQTQNYIEECLDSIENQTYFKDKDNFEVLVGVDACQDTLNKLIEIRHKYRNLSIFMMKENKGTYVTANTLLGLVKYDNIVLFGSDDVMSLEMINEIMKNSDDCDVIKLSYNSFDGSIKKRGTLTDGTIFYKKRVIELSGGYRDWICGADSEFLKRINKRVKIKQIEKGLFRRRIHNNALTVRSDTGYGSALRKTYSEQSREYNDNEDIKIIKVINKYQKIGNRSKEIGYGNLTPTLINPLSSSMPLVTVIIAYNEYRGFLEQAIKSIENQTYKNIEIIISFSENGESYNLNRAIEISSGTYIKYLDEDDILPEDSIENSVNIISQGNFDFIHGNAMDFNERGDLLLNKPRALYPTLEKLLEDNVINGGTLMYHKRVFKSYGLFDETLWTAEEYDFNLKLLNCGCRIGYCDKILHKYRRHNKQKSLGNTNIDYQNKRKTVFEKIKNRYKINKRLCSVYSSNNHKEEENNKYKNLVPTIINNIPLVSVIIPYNKNRGFLEDAINSVESQTYKNVELILSYSENGISYNLNQGIKASNGTYIKYLCEDDLLQNDSIENSVRTMMKEDYDFVHGNSIDFNESESISIKYIPSITYPTLQDLIKNNVINGTSVMYHRRVFENYGLFDETIWTSEEYDFNLRLLKNGTKIGYCNKFLCKYRIHDNQKSVSNKDFDYQHKRRMILKKIIQRYEINNDTIVKKNKYNIFAAIPVNGRHDLLPYTIDRLLTKCGVSKVYCMGDNENDKKICENAGAEWINHSNSPLGSKWNSGIEAAIKSGINYDGFLFIGSSDWVSYNWVEEFAPYLEEYDMIGTTNCHFLDINDNGKKRIIHWKGYSNDRKGEPIGIGRMYSMRIIRKLKGKIFPENLNSGMDLYSMKNIISNGGKIKCFDNKNTKSLSISTNKWVNMHKFDTEVKKDINSVEVLNVDEWLKAWFSDGFKIFSHRISQVYVSKSVDSFKDELKEKYKLKDFYDPNRPVFIFGMHRNEDYNFALNHSSHKIIFWCGSDAMNIRNNVYDLKNVTHIAGSKFVSDDLNKKNIAHSFIPVTTASFDLPVCPRGDYIYFYHSKESPNFYGFQFINEIKKRTGLKIIIATHNTYSHDELIDIYENCFVGLRMTLHDGVPTTGCELGLMGRRIIHNGNQPNCLNYKDINDVVRLINEEYEHRNEDNSDIANEMRKFLDVGDYWLYELPTNL